MVPGSIVALVTPMQANNQQIDFVALEQLITEQISNGTSALVILGTTGEAPTLEATEKTALIKHAVKQAQAATRKIPVIIGTGTNCTATTIKLSQMAQDLGADGVLITTPYYNKPTQDGLFLHYQAISQSIDIPIILYNVPGRTACDLLPSTVSKLSELNNIIGIKEASGDLTRIPEILQHTPEDFMIWSGCDDNIDDIIQLGAHGVISVTANVAPKLITQLVDYALAGNYQAAKQLQKKLMPLHDQLFCESNPIPVKWAMHYLGKIDSGIRLPLTQLAEPYHASLIAALKLIS